VRCPVSDPYRSSTDNQFSGPGNSSISFLDKGTLIIYIGNQLQQAHPKENFRDVSTCYRNFGSFRGPPIHGQAFLQDIDQQELGLRLRIRGELPCQPS